MQDASEAARQIVEFEELVSRLDRINERRSAVPPASASVPPPPPPPPLPPPVSLSVPSSQLDAAPPAHHHHHQQQEHQPGQNQRQRVRVHIGIDEDLRMILEMDPSIVDRAPAPVLLPSSPHANGHATFARSLRATRPQGWYWIARDVKRLSAGNRDWG
ncbi:hypothetical protein KM043_005703 [Ampulex compressa]|nr:hypothetical protein KM043_005703 [Ampulex compressa]